MFGEVFPYWEVPGLEFPETVEILCLNANECPTFPPLVEGQGNTWDGFSNQLLDTFVFYCHMQGDRGGGDLVDRI